MKARLRPAVISLMALSAAYCASLPRPDEGRTYAVKPLAEMSIMTYNVACPACYRKFPWKIRATMMHEIIEKRRPDLLAVQEFSNSKKAAAFRAKLTKFGNYEAVCTDGGENRIYYNSDRFLLLEKGSFSLPPGYRSAVYAVFRDKSSGGAFLFLNTHFDNNGRLREWSATKILRMTAPWRRRMPVIVTGDFNASASGYSLLRPNKGRYASKCAFEKLNGALKNAFRLTRCYNLRARPGNPEAARFRFDCMIDHVFFSAPRGAWSVSDWTLIFEKGEHDGIRGYPSDH